MKNRLSFLIAALVLAVLSSGAQADLAEVGHDIKQGTKDAAKKTGHAVRDAAHATGHAAKSVGHGVADATRNGYHATKRAVKRVFHKSDQGE